MKKNNFKRAFSLALMLIMLVSLASIGVSASMPAPVNPELYTIYGTAIQQIFVPNEDNPDYSYINNTIELPMNWNSDVVVKASDFEQYLQPHKYTGAEHATRDITLELAGIKLADKDLPLKNLGDGVIIPAFPKSDSEELKSLSAAQREWIKKYTYLDPNEAWLWTKEILVTYKWHHHNLQGSQMYFDDNYHWQLCTECGNRAYLSNHTDRDADGKCDFCGNAIRYYNVTVKDAAGGKVTLSANKGAMNGKISVTVTPDAGYHLESIKFFNNNAQHSQLTRYEDKAGSEYHFVILNWDIEVEASFVKD